MLKGGTSHRRTRQHQLPKVDRHLSRPNSNCHLVAFPDPSFRISRSLVLGILMTLLFSSQPSLCCNLFRMVFFVLIQFTLW